jgi:hypothetical protein
MHVSLLYNVLVYTHDTEILTFKRSFWDQIVEFMEQIRNIEPGFALEQTSMRRISSVSNLEVAESHCSDTEFMDNFGESNGRNFNFRFREFLWQTSPN